MKKAPGIFDTGRVLFCKQICAKEREDTDG